MSWAIVIQELANAGVTGDALVRIISAIEQVTNVTPNVREQSVTPSAWRMRKRRERLKKEREQQASQVASPVTNKAELRDIDNNTNPTGLDKSISPKRNAYPSQFEEIWNLFPRKVGKDDAFRSWKKNRGRIEHEALKTAISKHAALVAGKEKQFIPHPATWLNDGRWQDEELQPPQPLVPISGSKKWVAYGSDQWLAWVAHRKHMGSPPVNPNNGGYWFLSEWPPDVQTPAMKRTA